MNMVETYDEPDKQGAARPRQPVQKLQYSGHTAWVMAIISKLAYMRFEEEYLNSLLALSAEVAKAFGRLPSDSVTQRYFVHRHRGNQHYTKLVLVRQRTGGSDGMHGSQCHGSRSR